MITVTRKESNEENYVFEVVVTSDDKTTTSHIVLVDPAYHIALSGGAVSPEVLVEKSFEFLLAHEPKESILKEFDLSMITEYFPSYEHDISITIQRG